MEAGLIFTAPAVRLSATPLVVSNTERGPPRRPLHFVAGGDAHLRIGRRVLNGTPLKWLDWVSVLEKILRPVTIFSSSFGTTGGLSLKLDEYKRSGRARYEKLAAKTAELLERAITGEGGYRLQQIQHRAKTVESLSRRIEEIGERRWNRSLPEHLRSAARVVEAHDRLVKNMVRLRETLNADEEFVAFKTIVGYKSVFPHQWEEEGSDFRSDEAVREQRQDELADSITPANWAAWKSRLATAANVKSSDGATFPPYARFLSAIASRQPRLAFELLSDRSILPDWTLRAVAYALLEGELRVDVEALLGQWLDQSRFVPEIAGLVVSTVNVDVTLISRAAERAVKDADEGACHTLGRRGCQALR